MACLSLHSQPTELGRKAKHLHLSLALAASHEMHSTPVISGYLNKRLCLHLDNPEMPPLLLASAEFPGVLIFAHKLVKRAILTYLRGRVWMCLWKNRPLTAIGVCVITKGTITCVSLPGAFQPLVIVRGRAGPLFLLGDLPSLGF